MKDNRKKNNNYDTEFDDVVNALLQIPPENIKKPKRKKKKKRKTDQGQ